MSAPSPQLARIRRAVKAAISLNGGIDGAAATCGKSRSLLGNFNARDRAETPCLADALALDEVAGMRGAVPPIVAALAAELGCAVVRLPEAGGFADCSGDLKSALLDAVGEFGDVATRLRGGMAGGVPCPQDRDALVVDIDEAIVALVRMRVLAGGE